MSPESVVLIASLIGGTIAVMFFYIILETLIFKRISDDPVAGKLSATAAAWVVVSLLYGFTRSGDTGFTLAGFVAYLPGAMLVAIYAYRRGLRVRQRMTDSVETAFD
jgi:membrane associated rhomboid family serine protease